MPYGMQGIAVATLMFVATVFCWRAAKLLRFERQDQKRMLKRYTRRGSWSAARHASKRKRGVALLAGRLRPRPL